MKSIDRFVAAEHLCAHAIMRGELPAPTHRDPHPFVPFVTYSTARFPTSPEVGRTTAEFHYNDVLVELVRSACGIREPILLGMADLKVTRIALATFRERCAAHAVRLNDLPFLEEFEEDAEHALMDAIRLAQVADVCLTGCGDRDALARLAETSETCVAIGSDQYVPFALGARAVLAHPDGIEDWRPGPPLTVIAQAIDRGNATLARRARTMRREGLRAARETHAEAMDDDRAGLARIPASVPGPGPGPEPEAPAVVPPGHVLVVPRMGGSSKGQTNKDVASELKSVLGIPLPLYAFPRDRRALVEQAAAEAPHARPFFERLVSLQDSREHWAIPPVLALGPPGGGKTTALDRFFRSAGVHVARYACDGSSDNAAAGTPRRWTSTEVCFPLRSAMDALHANPACLWDEVNRVGGHRQGSGGTLRDALTSFLEPANARRYRDPSVEAEVDVSYVIHAATANGTDGIAAQVLDRLTVLEFPLPTRQDMPVLARRMSLDIARRQGLPDEEGELDRAELQALSEHWPGGCRRGLKRLVEVALRARMAAPYATRH
jgi:hypothetical protein